MAYIGNTPALQYITHAKQTFTADSSTVAFTLSNAVANENELEVFVNNVRQEPGSGKAYTASGTTLTMSEAPTTGDDFYCIYQGKATQTVTPGSGSVTNAMLAGSIANAKLANSSITLNSSAVSLGGSHTIQNTPAFLAVANSDQTGISQNTYTKIANFGNEIFDTDNTWDGGRFTPGVAGKFFMCGSVYGVGTDATRNFLNIKKNGSAMVATSTHVPGATTNFCQQVSAIVQSDNTTDYFEFFWNSTGANNTTAYSSGNEVVACAYKIVT